MGSPAMLADKGKSLVEAGLRLGNLDRTSHYATTYDVQLTSILMIINPAGRPSSVIVQPALSLVDYTRQTLECLRSER